jgi:hypothetical protein
MTAPECDGLMKAILNLPVLLLRVLLSLPAWVRAQGTTFTCQDRLVTKRAIPGKAMSALKDGKELCWCWLRCNEARGSSSPV